MSIKRRTDEEIFLRAKNDLPLSLRELSVASGHCLSVIQRWKRAGMPMWDGRVTLRESLNWRRNQPSKLGTPDTKNPLAASGGQKAGCEPPLSIDGHPLLQRAGNNKRQPDRNAH